VIDNMMGPWETAPEEVVEEELDIFAELGAVRPSQAQQPLHQMAPMQASHDPLAMFMDDDDEEETLIAGETAFSIESELNSSASEPVAIPTPAATENTTSPLSAEVISQLLEVLVKKELHSRVERGEDWLSDLPAEAIAKIESAKVIKDQQAYHLSLIIDMVGTGEVRPFATVLSTEQGTLPVAPPPQIPSSWHPLYNALRELLLNAMNSLTALKVVAN
jgi:hypothetical protein